MDAIAANKERNIFERIKAYFVALKDDVVYFVKNFSIIKTFKSFYIGDTFKRIIRAKNIPAIIYLILNVLVVCGIFGELFGGTSGAVVFGLVLYAISVIIALSPMGEAILRRQQDCEIIKDPKVLSRLEPLFLEVKERAIAKQKDYVINDQIILYLKEDTDVNAFAVGRRTICVTTGLLECSDDEIKAVLAHEFGHLANRDTDLTLLITVGNFIITAVVSIFRFLIAFYHIVFSIISMFLGGKEGLIGRLAASLAKILITIFVDLLMMGWTKVGIWLVMKTSRETEYIADAFACDIGYSDGLLSFFRALDASDDGSLLEVDKKKKKVSLFAALAASHPETSQRIERITKAA